MNPQTAQPDEALDRIFAALRDVQPSRGLEQRITAGIAQAQAKPQRSSLAARVSQLIAGRLAPARGFALAAVALAVVVVVAIHHKSQTITQSNATSGPLHTLALPTKIESQLVLRPGKTRVPQGFSLRSHSPSETAGGLTPAPTEADPDALALAETLAPSRPIRPMPLTAEEHLLLLATRQGQPIEVAELETLRQPALEAAAEARERTTIRQYIHSLLGPLAAAEAINPTPLSDDTPTPQPSSR